MTVGLFKTGHQQRVDEEVTGGGDDGGLGQTPWWEWSGVSPPECWTLSYLTVKYAYNFRFEYAKLIDLLHLQMPVCS